MSLLFSDIPGTKNVSMDIHKNTPPPNAHFKVEKPFVVQASIKPRIMKGEKEMNTVKQYWFTLKGRDWEKE